MSRVKPADVPVGTVLVAETADFYQLLEHPHYPGDWPNALALLTRHGKGRAGTITGINPNQIWKIATPEQIVKVLDPGPPPDLEEET